MIKRKKKGVEEDLQGLRINQYLLLKLVQLNNKAKDKNNMNTLVHQKNN